MTLGFGFSAQFGSYFFDEFMGVGGIQFFQLLDKLFWTERLRGRLN